MTGLQSGCVRISFSDQYKSTAMTEGQNTVFCDNETCVVNACGQISTGEIPMSVKQTNLHNDHV